MANDINKQVIVSRELINELDEIFTIFYSGTIFDNSLNTAVVAYKLGYLQGHLERDLLKYNKD